jgi:hypothetical protein
MAPCWWWPQTYESADAEGSKQLDRGSDATVHGSSGADVVQRWLPAGGGNTSASQVVN